MAATFRGFNTVDTPKPSYSLRDVELVKRDLLNHFHTRKGERVMLPDFGSDLPLYVFEPMVESVIDEMRQDVMNVIGAEPRAEFVDMEVIESDHLVRIEVHLLFKPGDIADSLYVDFTKESV